MLKLDMAAFVGTVEQLPEQEAGTLLFGTGYLTEHVALPFLFGEDISLRDMDWDAFDPEDARGMYFLCEQADGLGGPVLHLYQPAVYTKPAPQPQIFYV